MPYTAFKPATAARAFSHRSVLVFGKNSSSTDAIEDIGAAGTAAVVAGLISNPIMLYSKYVLKNTGAGVPPGPCGIFGALEGISYLVVVGIIAWSIYINATTGSGLPAGPSGLLGAVEGVSYLSLLKACVVFGLTFLEKGSLPGITG